MSESWPDHSSELCRKTMEEVLRRVDQMNAGRLSRSGLWHILDTLTNVTQGLIPSGDWQLIYDLQKDIRKEIANDATRRLAG